MLTDRPALALAFFGQVANAHLKKALADHGLKPGQGHALLLLGDRRRMSQQAIVEELGVDPSVLVSILNDLEADGLAERRRDPADRRRHVVEVTARGRRLITQVNHGIEAAEAELFSALAPGEVEMLVELLNRVRTGDAAPDDEC